MYNHKEGISLRKVERDDLFELFALKQESWWGTHKVLISNSEDQQRWFNCIPTDQLFMIAYQPKDNRTVGVAVYSDIDWVSRSLNISGSIMKEFRNPTSVKAAFSAGLDFAFEMLNMRRVGAEVLEFNRPSQKLEIDHLGFTVEGRKRKAVYRCGEYYDSIVLGLLREEWRSQERVLAHNGCCNENFNRDLAAYCCERAATLQPPEAFPSFESEQ